MDYRIMKKLFDLVVSKCNRMIRLALKRSKDLFLVDSTMITVGKSRLPWAFYHGERAGINYMLATLLLLKCLFKSLTRLAYVWWTNWWTVDRCSIYPGRSSSLFFKLKRIDQFKEDRQMFVIRMKENVEIFRPHALQTPWRSWSSSHPWHYLSTGHRAIPFKEIHRVVLFKDDHGNEMRVVTNLMTVSPWHV